MTKIISSSLLSNELQKQLKLEVASLKNPKRVLSKTELSEVAQGYLDIIVKGTWTQREDGKIDVKGNVEATRNRMLHLFMGKEIFFGNVTGDFDCYSANITSLKGAPEKVDGYFDCQSTKIASLEGAPEEVGGGFFCGHIKTLTSLQGAPKTVGRNFDCNSTKITSLEGAPEEVGRDFNCAGTKITSLEGAPEVVGGNFICSHIKTLTSLDGIGEVKGKIYSDLK